MLEFKEVTYLYRIFVSPLGRVEEVNTSEGYLVLDRQECQCYLASSYFSIEAPLPSFFVKINEMLYITKEEPNYYV